MTRTCSTYPRRSDSQYGSSIEQSASDGSVDRPPDSNYLQPRLAPSLMSASLPSPRNQQRLGINGTRYHVQMRINNARHKPSSMSTPLMMTSLSDEGRAESEESDADTCAASQSSATDTNSQHCDSIDDDVTASNDVPENSYCMTLPTCQSQRMAVAPRRRGASTSSTGARSVLKGPPIVAPKPRLSFSQATEGAPQPVFCSIQPGPERVPPPLPNTKDVNLAAANQNTATHNILNYSNTSDVDSVYSPTSITSPLIRDAPANQLSSSACNCSCHASSKNVPAVTSRSRWQRNKSTFSSSSSAQPLLSNSSADATSCRCGCHDDGIRSPTHPQVLYSSDNAECVVMT